MNNKGFTLIELILVIAILGILAVAAMPRIFSLTDEAVQAQIDGTVGNIKTAIMLYAAQQMAQTGMETYPANLDDSAEETECSEANPCFGPILKDPITEPSWTHINGNNWDYHYGATTLHYHYNPGTGVFYEGE